MIEDAIASHPMAGSGHRFGDLVDGRIPIVIVAPPPGPVRADPEKDLGVSVSKKCATPDH